LTTDDQPRESGPIHTFWKITNGHLQVATHHAITYVFSSRLEFSGTADRTALFPVGSNPRWRPQTILCPRTLCSKYVSLPTLCFYGQHAMCDAIACSTFDREIGVRGTLAARGRVATHTGHILLIIVDPYIELLPSRKVLNTA